MYNMIQKSDRDNHDYFVTLENSMNNMIPIGSRFLKVLWDRNDNDYRNSCRHLPIKLRKMRHL